MQKQQNERHPIIKWHEHFVDLSRGQQPDPATGLLSAVRDGILSAFLTVAYDLSVLRNYSKLQDEVVIRLRHLKRAIESGRFSHEEEAVQEALALWEDRERRRPEILASLDEAEASLTRGEGRPITEESMKALAEDVKRRGRARLAAERNASH